MHQYGTHIYLIKCLANGLLLIRILSRPDVLLPFILLSFLYHCYPCSAYMPMTKENRAACQYATVYLVVYTAMKRHLNSFCSSLSIAYGAAAHSNY